VTFKRRTGVYFWSIIVTTIGIILQTTGYILVNFENNWPKVFIIIICKIGWVSNVTGFAIVLWSRLHLVVYDPKILKWILIMILVNGFLCHTPLVVLEFGVISSNRAAYIRPIEVMEKIQQTIFTLQETIISGLYIYNTRKFLFGYATYTRNVIGILIGIQVLVITLDAGLTAFDYLEWITLKCTIHPFVYSIKLKLEFIILNQLLTIVKRGLIPNMRSINTPQFPGNDPAQVNPSGDGVRRSSLPLNHSTAAPASKEAMNASQTSGATSAAITVVQEVSVLSSNASTDVSMTSQNPDEHNLRDVVGSTEESAEEMTRPTSREKEMDDIERQYLGRYKA
jgi:hypothetical protein